MMTISNYNVMYRGFFGNNPCKAGTITLYFRHQIQFLKGHDDYGHRQCKTNKSPITIIL